MTVIVDGRETVLGPMDSCTIAPGEVREIVNRVQPCLQDAGGHPLSAGSKAMSDWLTESAVAVRRARQGCAHHRRVGRLRRARRARCWPAPGAKLRPGGRQGQRARGDRRRLPRAGRRGRGGQHRGPTARPPVPPSSQAPSTRFGRLDILVVASGKNDVAKIDDMAPARFLDVMDANVTQSWLMARAATDADAEAGRGRQDRARCPRPAACSATRRATRPIAPRSRRSTASPGRSAASLGRPASPSTPSRRRSSARRSPPGCSRTPRRRETVRKGFLARVPKGRLGEPEDLAGPLLFLASRASDFYTGHILYADGGYTAGVMMARTQIAIIGGGPDGPRHRAGLCRGRP